MSMKKISIIVPVYQAEKYLDSCICSILSQTYKNLEVILIDDGSTDRSGRICDKYAEQDPRIRVIHKQNQGVSIARNCGLDVATGDFCTFVDSDDTIEKEMYSSMMEVIRNYSCDVVMCDCVKVSGEKKVPYTHNIRAGYYNREQLRKEYFPHLLIMPEVEYPATISNCLILFNSKYINLNSNGQRLRYMAGIRYSEDLLFGAELLYHADSFYYMKARYLYHYRMEPGSVSHSFVRDKWTDYLALYKAIRNEFGNSSAYNFSDQIDKTLLFFVLNSVGDILRTDAIDEKEKKKLSRKILMNDYVVDMFKRLNIRRLPITHRQKTEILLFKYRIGLGAYMRYLSRKATSQNKR